MSDPAGRGGPPVLLCKSPINSSEEHRHAMEPSMLAQLKDLAAILGIVVAIGSLAFAALGIWLTGKTNRARFWLDLRSAFAKHDDVHRRLRTGGDWAENKGPKNSDEYFQLEAYMGLFEHGEIMLDQGLIDERTFREIYRYRLVNLVANDWVRIEKLCHHADGWPRFIALLKRMNVQFKC